MKKEHFPLKNLELLVLRSKIIPSKEYTKNRRRSQSWYEG